MRDVLLELPCLPQAADDLYEAVPGLAMLRLYKASSLLIFCTNPKWRILVMFPITLGPLWCLGIALSQWFVWRLSPAALLLLLSAVVMIRICYRSCVAVAASSCTLLCCFSGWFRGGGHVSTTHSLLFDKKRKTLMGLFVNVSASKMPTNEVWPLAVTQAAHDFKIRTWNKEHQLIDFVLEIIFLRLC